jgi:hypothetical protein
MVLYVCPRCGYSANRKGNIKTHLSKKKPCKNIFSNTDRDILLGNIDLCNQEYDNQIELEENKSKIDKYKQILGTDVCNDNQKFLISQLAAKDAQIDKLIECVNKQKRSSVTFNKKNTVHVHLNAHNATDFSHITDKDYRRIMNHAVGAIREFVCKAHFDPEVPQNRNIYISNLRNNHVMLFDGKKWNLQDRDTALDSLIDRSEFTMEQKLEEWIDNEIYYPDIMKRFKLYLDNKEEDEIRNNIKEQIKMILYNKRPR